MARHGVTRGSDSALLDLVVIVESEPEVDSDQVGRLARQFRTELRNLEIESISPITLENVPPGAKGVDPASLGALLITLSATGGVFPILIETARDWLARHTTARRISVTIDGDTLVLEKASKQEQSVLIDAYMHHHGMK